MGWGGVGREELGAGITHQPSLCCASNTYEREGEREKGRYLPPTPLLLGTKGARDVVRPQGQWGGVGGPPSICVTWLS